MRKENDDVQHFAKIIKDIKYAMLTTHDVDGGNLCSRPMTLQEVEFDGDLWFFASKVSMLVTQIDYNSRVNLAFSNPKNNSFLSAQGVAEIIEDKKKAKELWNPFYKAWFPEGLEDPNLCLIRVTVESADYWESPDSKIVTLVGFAKAILTGKKADKALGNHGHMEFN
jgi:general stress protein 26